MVQTLGGKPLAMTQAKFLQFDHLTQMNKAFVLNSSPTRDTPQIQFLQIFQLNEVLKTVSLDPTALQIQAFQILELADSLLSLIPNFRTHQI